MSESLLRAENLVKRFPIYGGLFSTEVAAVKAVQGVSFDIKKGETLGLVGESGCGKSTLGRSLIRLIEPTSGKIFFKNQDITNVSGDALRELRKKMQIIFQDPYASLNPRMTIGAILEEPLIIHNLFDSPKDRFDRVKELINLVGLRPEHLSRYPHEFSGGQRQRVESRVLSPSIPNSSSATSPFRLWTFPFRRRLSTCSWNCSRSSALLMFSSHMI